MNGRSRPVSSDGEGFFTPRRIVGLCLAVLAVLFVLQNRQDVTLQIVGFRVTGPLWFATAAVLGVGVAIGALLTSRRSG